ncbi:FIST sensor-containing two-component system histidine kinase [Poseidonibacter lekithochrous]|nr:FIST sensor-containing two-component system histidine kinase [Poseidonibacter lekithochrous]
MLQYFMKTFNYTLKQQSLTELIDFSLFKNEKSVLIQVFCGSKKSILQNIINTLIEELPQSICIGSSTDGEINNDQVSTKKTIISISVFKNTSLKTYFVKNKDSFKNGYDLAKELCQEDTKLLITFTDGAKTNGEAFLKGIEAVNNTVPVSGGMAGDNANFKQTFISSQDKILTNGAVAVALNSNTLKAQNAYNFNWSPIGIEHTIDKVKDNRVYEISGMKPLDFYEKYLGEYVAKALPATGIEFPLIVKRNNLPIARAVIKKHKDGSLSFAGNLYKGDVVKLGFGNVELIMNNPVESLFEHCNIQKAESFFIYSCMARRRYMPSMIDIEIKPFSDIAPTSGFFTYGEFYHKDGHNELLNQTLTIVALSEEDCNESFDKNSCEISNETTSISEHARSLQALTHLIQQSSNDYNDQSKELEKGKIYAQNLLNSQKQFLKHAVHETNTPLSIIMGNIEMFEIQHGKNKFLSNIEVALKNVSSIYDDLSYLIKKDQVNEAVHEIDLVDFVRSRIDFFSQSAIKFKSTFNFKASNDEIIINFNETKLQRIVDNNLTNAIKYTLANEVIYVSLNIINQDCNFIIESKSKQILDQQKIFEEYYREETNVQEGFGLGLNLVKRICSEENVGIQLQSGENWASFTYTFKEIK